MYATRLCWVLLATLPGQADAYRSKVAEVSGAGGKTTDVIGLEAGRQARPASEVRKMSELLTFGLRTITSTTKIFMEDEVDIHHALSTCQEKFWELVLKVVPEDQHESEAMVSAKQVWDEVFETSINVTQDILDFRATGDTDKLMQAIKTIISKAFKNLSVVFPQEAKYFKALQNLAAGIGESWDEFTEGNTTKALELIWGSLKDAIDDLVPEDWSLAKDETYTVAMGMIDDVISKLSQVVLEYRRQILNSKVCYRQTQPREQVRPSLCHEGFEWDQDHLCIPQGNGNGAGCLELCGGRAGMCDSFCGEGRACCRQGYPGDPVECEGAGGFVNHDFAYGVPEEYHQCVSPGPRVAFRVQGAGNSEVNGLYVQTGTHSGRPRYEKINARKKTIMEWSDSRRAWRLFVYGKWFGLGHSSTLYRSEEDAAAFPTSGWTHEDGVPPVPAIVPRVADEGSSLYQASASEGKAAESAPYGAHEALCDGESEYNETYTGWCLKPCPPGFQPLKSATRCIQSCGGKYPVESFDGTLCGTDQGELMVAVTEMLGQGAIGAVESYGLVKEGVHVDELTDTVDVFVDLAKPFARPQCP